MNTEQEQRMEQIRSGQTHRRWGNPSISALLDDIDFLLSIVKGQEADTVAQQSGDRMKVINDTDPWFEQVNDALSYVSMCPHSNSLHIRREDFEALSKLVETEGRKRKAANRKPLLDLPDKD